MTARYFCRILNRAPTIVNRDPCTSGLHRDLNRVLLHPLVLFEIDPDGCLRDGWVGRLGDLFLSSSSSHVGASGYC